MARNKRRQMTKSFNVKFIPHFFILEFSGQINIRAQIYKFIILQDTGLKVNQIIAFEEGTLSSIIII